MLPPLLTGGRKKISYISVDFSLSTSLIGISDKFPSLSPSTTVCSLPLEAPINLSSLSPRFSLKRGGGGGRAQKKLLLSLVTLAKGKVPNKTDGPREKCSRGSFSPCSSCEIEIGSRRSQTVFLLSFFPNRLSPCLIRRSRLLKLVPCLYFLQEQSPFGKGGEGGRRKGAAAAASGANMKDEASLPPRLLLLLGALESSVAFACVFARFERRAEEKLGAFLTQTTLQKHSTWKCRRAVEILPCSGKPHGIFRIRSA